jgi:hypothetical protein
MAEYRQICVIGGNDSEHFLVRSNGYFGGENIEHPSSAPTAGQCAVYLKGGSFATKKEKAVTWSDGLSVPGLGLKVSMQTGYDQSAEVHYKFAANRHVCGQGVGPGSAKVVVVKA